MKILLVLFITTFSLGVVNAKASIDFGDYRSTTLTTKAWKALARNDMKAVLAYTNKCITLYAPQAKKMQAGVMGYASGSNEDIFLYWALNDVATSYFIQGEAYRAAHMKDKAKEAYSKIISDYSFGQCWDTRGWFWKPAEAAKEILHMMEAGVNWDFGNGSSVTLVSKAWAALAHKDLQAVLAYTNKCISLYAQQAKAMQAGLKDYVSGSNKKIFKYWALNDVATSYFIQGEAYRAAHMKDNAKEAYGQIVSDYSFGQCWNPGIPEFSLGDFKGPMTPEALIKAIQTGAGINLPPAETSIESLNNLLEDKNLYKMMPKRSDEARGLSVLIEPGQQLNLAETKELNRTLIEINYPKETPTRTGWFWKPADAASENISMIAAGVDWDFGDSSSNTLVQKAWAALAANDLKAVEAYVNQTLKLYAVKAKDMQASMKDYASGSNDDVFNYWAVNDVGTALFILGEAYQNNGRKEDAVSAYKRVINEFFYSQCWDPHGWFWKPAEGAQVKLGELEDKVSND